MSISRRDRVSLIFSSDSTNRPTLIFVPAAFAKTDETRVDVRLRKASDCGGRGYWIPFYFKVVAAM